MTNVSFADNQVYFEAGGPEAEDGKFLAPAGIAIDQQGNIYVADTGNNRLQKFDKQGKFLAKIVSSEKSGLLVAPRGVAIDREENIYLACTDKILKFNKASQQSGSFGSHSADDGNHLANPYQMAIKTDGQLLVADRSALRLKVFTKEPKFVGYFGPQHLPAHVIAPKGVATDNQGHVYITTEDNHVYKFDASGKNILLRFGSYGSKEGEFDRPHDITINHQGEIFVADSGNHRVQVFDARGKFITQFGQVDYLGGLTVDLQNNVYLVDSGNNYVLKFNSRGQQLLQFGAKGTAGYL